MSLLSLEMKFRSEIKSQSSWPLAKWRLRLRFINTLSLALSLRERERMRVVLGLRHPRRQPNPRLQRPRMADVFLHRPQQSGLPERKESISQCYMGAVPRGAF